MDLPTEIQEQILLTVDRSHWINLSEVCTLWNELLSGQVEIRPDKLSLLRKGDLFTLARSKTILRGSRLELEALAQSGNLEAIKEFVSKTDLLSPYHRMLTWEELLRAIIMGGHLEVIKYWFKVRQKGLKYAKIWSKPTGYYCLSGRKDFIITEKTVRAAQEKIQKEARYWWSCMME